MVETIKGTSMALQCRDYLQLSQLSGCFSAGGSILNHALQKRLSGHHGFPHKSDKAILNAHRARQAMDTWLSFALDVTSCALCHN